MQYNDTHDDVIFTQIREKYKKDENIFDLIANKFFPYSIYFLIYLSLSKITIY